MKYIWCGENNSGENEAVGKFVSRITWGDERELFPGFTSLGVIKGNRLIAGVIYHDYKPAAQTIEMSCAAIDPTWVGGPTLYLMYKYPFEELKCRMIGTGNAGNNTRLHKQLRKLDHREYIIDNYWADGEDCHFWTLTKEAYECNNLINRAKKIWMAKHVATSHPNAA